MSAQQALLSRHISTRSTVQMCSELGQFIRNSPIPERAASSLVREMLGLNVTFNDPVYAGVAVKALAVELFSVNFVVDEPKEFLESALEYATQFKNDPQWSFLWAQPEDDEMSSKVDDSKVQVVEGLDVKVAVKANGKIKKGGKQILALELYKKHVVDATSPLNNQQFISLIMKELDMTKAGATTYAYNCGKARKEGLI